MLHEGSSEVIWGVTVRVCICVGVWDRCAASPFCHPGGINQVISPSLLWSLIVVHLPLSLKKKKITAKATKKMRSVIKKSSPGSAARRKLGNMLLYCTHDISFPLFDFFWGAGWGWETNTGITWLCFTPYSNSESNRLLKQGDTRTEQRLLHIKPHDSTIKGRKIKHSQILVHR